MIVVMIIQMKKIKTMTNDNFNKQLEQNHEQGELWNNNRSKVEKEGIEKFWRLKELYRENAKMKELGWSEYCKNKSNNLK